MKKRFFVALLGALFVLSHGASFADAASFCVDTTSGVKVFCTETDQSAGTGCQSLTPACPDGETCELFTAADKECDDIDVGDPNCCICGTDEPIDDIKTTTACKKECGDKPGKITVGLTCAEATAKPPAAAAPETAKAEEAKVPREVILTIAIGKLTQTGDIAVYLAALYSYALQIVGMLAIAMIVWGGIKYLTAGGDMSRVKSARETIANALIGLILAFATYLILATVNPALTTFKSIIIPPIQRTGAVLTNWCEDALELNAFVARIEPAEGECGDAGKLIPKEGQRLLKEDCVFRGVCSGSGTCALVTKDTFACTQCWEWDALKLRQKGALSGSDIECQQFAQDFSDPEKTKAERQFVQCVYVNDTSARGEQACGLLHLNDCGPVHTCRDYEANVRVEFGDEAEPGFKESIDAAYERRCALDLTAAWVAGACAFPQPTNHLKRVCDADPCSVGPCEGRPAKLATFEKLTGIGGTIQAEYCCPKGIDCTK